MINAVLIDDELHCLKTLSILLREYCREVNVLEQCRSANEGLQAIRRTQPDLVFLDVEMPGKNGFELLEGLTEISFAVIFTTGYDQYAIKAIRFSALDYLLKPIDAMELMNALKRVEGQRLPMQDQFKILLNQLQNRDCLNKVAVPTMEGFELIPIDDIIQCEADDNYTHLYLKTKRIVTVSRTLKEVEEQLQHLSFFVRVHHSHLVNLKEVTKYVRGEGGYLVMNDGSSISVSRSRKEALLKFF